MGSERDDWEKGERERERRERGRKEALGRV